MTIHLQTSCLDGSEQSDTYKSLKCQSKGKCIGVSQLRESEKRKACVRRLATCQLNKNFSNFHSFAFASWSTASFPASSAQPQKVENPDPPWP